MEQEAKIFLSEERGVTNLDWFRSYNTFNFGNYQNEYKTAVNRLYMLNDDTLAGGKNLNMSVASDSLLILLPVVGAVSYSDTTGNSCLAEAGCLQVIALPAGSSYTISNPYTEDLVNFLQFSIQLIDKVPRTVLQNFLFEIDEHKNMFISSALEAGVSFHIAKLDGREKATVQFSQNATAVFAFVIEGAFEIEERLLQARDGLALWNSKQAEMEALSNNAIIFLLEMKD